MFQKREFGFEGRSGGFGGGRSGGFGGGRSSFRSTAPVKEGDELDVTIEAVGSKGDGIAKKDGFILFVPGVKQGDRVRIRITKVLSKVGFAEVAGAAQSSAPEQPATQSTEDLPDAPQASAEAPAQDSESFGEESPAPSESVTEEQSEDVSEDSEEGTDEE